MALDGRKTTLLGILCVVLLSACSGEDDKRAAKAAAWLQDTAALRELPPGWTVEKVTARGSDGVDMEVHLSSAEQEKSIRALPQMQRFAAVQVACPKADDEIWTILTKEQKVWLTLIGASGEKLTHGNCWRR